MAFADSDRFELEPLDPEPGDTAARLYSALLEDLYWSSTYWREPYFRAGYDYEDYAPAYCVGYSGCAQYGGRFEDAEKSLCSNFIRIKGDSRLTWEEAREPIRAAWERIVAAEADDPGMALQDGRLPAREAGEACCA